MSVVLGFDFGMKYIGVAVGQPLTCTATPVTTLMAQDGIPDWIQIEQLIAHWSPKTLVVGIPLHMDGAEQPMTFSARRFANRLHARFHLPVYAIDERLSTWEAKQRMGLSNRKMQKKTIESVNALAASILVEQWLHSGDECPIS